jgi:hypothetical protein
MFLIDAAPVLRREGLVRYVLEYWELRCVGTARRQVDEMRLYESAVHYATYVPPAFVQVGNASSV